MSINHKDITNVLSKYNGDGMLVFSDIQIPVHIESLSIDSPESRTGFRKYLAEPSAALKFEGRVAGDVKKKEEPKKEDNTFKIEKVTVNGPATIVFWKDGTKTVVKCQNGDKFDLEKGMAMAFAKKARGNSSKYYDVFKDIAEQYRDENRVENFVRNYCRSYEEVTGKPIDEREYDSIRLFAKAMFDV